MTITLCLPPEQEARLRRLAESAGVELDEYVSKMVEERLPEQVVPKANDDWDEWLDEFMERHPAAVHHLTDDDLSRENIYEDRA